MSWQTRTTRLSSSQEGSIADSMPMAAAVAARPGQPYTVLCKSLVEASHVLDRLGIAGHIKGDKAANSPEAWLSIGDLNGDALKFGWEMRGIFIGAAASWALLAAYTFPANGQPGGAASGVQQRHDELAKMKESLADPDPLVRLASMEAAVASGDATKTDMAIRIAFASDDLSMRNLALRTWVASLKRLTVDIVLPGDLQKIIDQAELDPKQAAAPIAKSEWLETWAAKTFQQTFEFSEVDVSKNTGKVIAIPSCCGYKPEDFTITGTQLTMSVWVPSSSLKFGPRCTFRMSPTASLTLQGTVSCGFNSPSPRLNVTAQMF